MITLPKRALWPGPLQRQVRRRVGGPQAPHAHAGWRAPGGLRRRRSGDRATTDARRRGTGAARSMGPTDADIGVAGCSPAEADAPLPEPANAEAQRTGHKPATIAFPKPALWPGPLQRQVRRRADGPQAPHAIDDVRAL